MPVRYLPEKGGGTLRVFLFMILLFVSAGNPPLIGLSRKQFMEFG
ncbi:MULTISPECIES: hypothetical protein [Paenibacillus]|nr:MULTISPECIES: hypothetical protein [Paenibacillus]